MSDIEYLSVDFFAELQKRGRELAEQPGLTLVVQYVIGDLPDGSPDVRYYFDIQDGRIEQAAREDAPTPDVTISATYADNVALFNGDLAASEAFMSGRLSPSGDLSKLTAMLPLVQSTGYQRMMAELRDISTVSV